MIERTAAIGIKTAIETGTVKMAIETGTVKMAIEIGTGTGTGAGITIETVVAAVVVGDILVVKETATSMGEEMGVGQ